MMDSGGYLLEPYRQKLEGLFKGDGGGGLSGRGLGVGQSSGGRRGV